MPNPQKHHTIRWGIVTYMPRDTPATPPTRMGRLQDLVTTEDTPNEAEIHLWTHGEDDEATVHAMLDTPEDAEEPPEDVEDPQEAFKQHLYCGGVYIERIMDD